MPYAQGRALADFFPEEECNPGEQRTEAGAAGGGPSLSASSAPPASAKSFSRGACQFVALEGFGHNDVWEYTAPADIGGGVLRNRSLLGIIAGFAVAGEPEP